MNYAINTHKKHVVEIKATLIYLYGFIDPKLMNLNGEFVEGFVISLKNKGLKGQKWGVSPFLLP